KEAEWGRTRDGPPRQSNAPESIPTHPFLCDAGFSARGSHVEKGTDPGPSRVRPGSVPTPPPPVTPQRYTPSPARRAVRGYTRYTRYTPSRRRRDSGTQSHLGA